MISTDSILGSGMVFPIILDDGGKPIIAKADELIKSSIRSILAYTLGERFFLRQFGANTDNLLEELNTELLEDILGYQITEAIAEFEKRVTRLSVRVESNLDTKLDIRLNYTIIQTQYQDSFIFPFYKQINY